MDEELNEELLEADRLALALAEHLRRMNAASVTIPVIIADEKYEVTVACVPVQPEANSD